MLKTEERDPGRLLHGVLIRRAKDETGKRVITGTFNGVTYYANTALDCVRSCMKHFGLGYIGITKENINVR